MAIFQDAVHKSVKKINGHGPNAQYGVKMLLPWDYGTYGEENTKRNSITCQTDQQSPSIGQPHIFIRISSIKDERRQFVACKKHPSSQRQRNSRPACRKVFPLPADCVKPAFLEVISGQKKRIEK